MRCVTSSIVLVVDRGSWRRPRAALRARSSSSIRRTTARNTVTAVLKELRCSTLQRQQRDAAPAHGPAAERVRPTWTSTP